MDYAWRLTLTALEAVLEHLPPYARRAIRSVGLTGVGDGVWLLDERGAPVRPAMMWADARASAVVRQWQKAELDRYVFSVTRTAPNAALPTAQLCWLIEHDPEALRRARWCVFCTDWLFFRFTGHVSTDVTHAGHAFCDHRLGEYDHDLLAALGIGAAEKLLAPLEHPGQRILPLRREVRNRIGLDLGGTSDVWIVAGFPDVNTSAIGLGVTQPGQVASVLGTAAIHEMIAGEDDVAGSEEPAGYTAFLGFGSRRLRMLPTSAGAMNLDWVLENVVGRPALTGAGAGEDEKRAFDILERQVARIEPGSDGVLYFPHLSRAGERAPEVLPGARALFAGLTPETTPLHLLRACYEGICFIARECYERFPRPFDSVHLGGGGAASPFWAQMWADVTGKVVLADATPYAGARAAAAYALAVTGLASAAGAGVDSTRGAEQAGRTWSEQISSRLLKAMRPILGFRSSRTFRPDPQRHRLYSEAFMRFKRLRQLMAELWKQG